MNKKVEFLLNLNLILGVLGYIALDLPLRTLISLSVFLFLPGYLILKTIDLRSGGFWRNIVLSVTFSISFLMIFGFLFNHLFLTIGLNRPLKYIHIGFSSILIILSFVRYNQDQIKKEINFKKSLSFLSNTTTIFFISLSIFIILLSIFSTVYMRIYDV